ncbi:CLUMA_CG017007, isoform A [Clunio marinus]|uniref:CLUMA_CG017007, isoform A n=1 Tax=Clunio marinus TaxID=568069 RepID=A0A1J1IUE6_9DIPT|nr:CLUMA_CG017007, isoform A [Clunio marinus]
MRETQSGFHVTILSAQNFDLIIINVVSVTVLTSYISSLVGCFTICDNTFPIKCVSENLTSMTPIKDIFFDSPNKNQKKNRKMRKNI